MDKLGSECVIIVWFKALPHSLSFGAYILKACYSIMSDIFSVRLTEFITRPFSRMNLKGPESNSKLQVLQCTLGLGITREMIHPHVLGQQKKLPSSPRKPGSFIPVSYNIPPCRYIRKINMRILYQPSSSVVRAADII